MLRSCWLRVAVIACFSAFGWPVMGIGAVQAQANGPGQPARVAAAQSGAALWSGPAAAFDLSGPCTGPDTGPLCAFKTYLACVLYDAPALCAAVGLAGIPERFPGPDTLDTEVLATPWALPFERLMPEAFALHLYNGGVVPAARFQSIHFTGGDTTPVFAPLPGYAEGNVELVLDIPEPYVKGMVYRLSAFFHQTGDRWRMVAWSSSREKACDEGFGTASWGPCRWFVADLRQRDVFVQDVTQVWASPKPVGRDDYPHPGLEVMMGLPHQPVAAPFAGTVVRRSLKYPDVPLYDWVVIEGTDQQAAMTVKFAMVDRIGPAPGSRIAAAALLGKPQWVESEHPGAGRFVHIELLRDGIQIDPRTVMRERRAQEPAQ